MQRAGMAPRPTFSAPGRCRVEKDLAVRREGAEADRQCTGTVPEFENAAKQRQRRRRRDDG